MLYPWIPKIRKIPKKTNSPPQGWAPKILKTINTTMAIFRPISYFLVFGGYFRDPTQSGEFHVFCILVCVFSGFRAFAKPFRALYQAREIATVVAAIIAKAMSENYSCSRLWIRTHYQITSPLLSLSNVSNPENISRPRKSVTLAAHVPNLLCELSRHSVTTIVGLSCRFGNLFLQTIYFQLSFLQSGTAIPGSFWGFGQSFFPHLKLLQAINAVHGFPEHLDSSPWEPSLKFLRTRQFLMGNLANAWICCWGFGQFLGHNPLSTACSRTAEGTRANPWMEPARQSKKTSQQLPTGEQKVITT